MASFLDTGLLGFFSIIFTFLLVYAITWGLLVQRKWLGDNKPLYAIIAFTFAFFFILSPPTRAYLDVVIPWFLVLAIIFFMIMVSVSIFANVSWEKVINDDTAKTWLYILVGIIAIGGAAVTFGQSALEAQTGTPQQVPVYNPETGAIVDGSGSLQPTGTSGVGPNGGLATQNYQVNLVSTLVHPKVVGLMLVFGLSALIIFFLSRPAGGK